MTKKARLVVVGAGETARLAYEYFTYDSEYEVVAFAVEHQFRKDDVYLGLPIVDMEVMTTKYAPKDYWAFVAISYTQLNRPRAHLLRICKQGGYRIATYVSSRAFVWRDVTIGENCAILEQNVLQSGVRIGDNVTLWSGNHIGHQTRIGDSTFVSSHAAIGGFSTIGEHCFLGLNCTVADRVQIASDCVIGAGAVVLGDTEPGRVYRGNPASAAAVGSLAAFGVRSATA